MTKALLEAVDLVKHYPAPRATPFGSRRSVRSVDGVSFAVSEGSTLGLIGESGCGKTTTAKMLLRLEDIQSGTLRFAGEDVTHARGRALADYRRQVQAVFQDPHSSLNPRRRVFDAVAEPLIANGADRATVCERVADLLHRVGLPADAAERLPHEFSGGQRQRIVIARGLALKPRVLILDEPVSALDVSIRAQILNLLQDLQDELGVSYILISHDMEVVAHMCRDVAVMYLGKVVESGRTADVVHAPQHPYTQALLSAVLPLHPREKKTRIPLKGPLPSPLDPPSGCVFRTRCPIAQPICAEQVPPPVTTQAGSVAACHFAS